MNNNIKKWELIYKNKKFKPEFPDKNVQDFCRYHLPINPKNFKILDLGCGPGINSLYLQKKGYEVYGIDSSSRAIQLTKKILKIKNKNKIKKCSFEKINFPDSYFDAIVCNAVLYYGSYVQVKEGIKEIYRLLKKNSIARIVLKTKRDHFFKDVKSLKISSKVVTQGWEKKIIFTFLDKKQIKELFKKFKKIIIGMEEFNYIDLGKIHSFWIITVQK